ncbi:MAG: Nif3-like dinuclear metal center hexameric protein, partial [Bacteroidota bacterium]|nr:Nif3-like dinuclear metal center hexameric protein [Bacteroidota bacterium]
YAAHTNIDSVAGGVSGRMCDKLGLTNRSILSPLQNHLKKLVTFVPLAQAEQVRQALFQSGAGVIGNYDQCSYNLEGSGTFRGNDQTHPFVGSKGELHFEKEIRIETIFPKHIQNNVIRALLESHPYEEVAYDIYPLDNEFPTVGMGMIGELPEPVEEVEFLQKVKQAFECKVIRYTKPLKHPVKKVALCGGAGSSLLGMAIASGADVFITGDFKYHQFFDAEDRIMIADIGHFESEQFTKEVFSEILTKKFPKFALHLSGIKTNPVNYLI